MRQAISAPDAPKAMGAYSPAVRAGNLLFISGQIPINPATGELVSGNITAEAEQVMRNLLTNAIKYMGDGPSPTIEIGSTARGAEVEVWVRDTGIGIDPAYHEKVFEIFQRLKEVEAEGSGVGLPIVKKIVQAAGGRIWVESARGRGSTFRFTWPTGPRR